MPFTAPRESLQDHAPVAHSAHHSLFDDLVLLGVTAPHSCSLGTSPKGATCTPVLASTCASWELHACGLTPAALELCAGLRGEGIREAALRKRHFSVAPHLLGESVGGGAPQAEGATGARL